MKTQLKTTFLFMLALFIYACNSSEYPGYKKTGNGLHYNIIKGNRSSGSPKLNDIITFSIVIKTESDSVILNSRENKQYRTLKLKKPSFKGDIMEGFAMMSIGDSASFICNGASFFSRSVQTNVPAFLKPGSNLVFNVRLIKSVSEKEKREEMLKKEEALVEKYNLLMKEDAENLKQYIKDNKITATPTDMGLYFIELKKGSGEKPVIGQQVLIHYTGKLLDGTEFHSTYKINEPFWLTLGSKDVLPGMNEGLRMMNTGSKARIIIPSQMAYADRPPKGSGIKKFQSIIIEVELLEVR